MIIQRLRNRQGGFTLIELLIVVAIIGIIAAILIPNLIDAIQKAKQKRTVADERTMGGALMSWVTDQVSGAAAGRRQAAGTYSLGTPLTAVGYTTLRDTILRPTVTFFYLQDVPQFDAWGNPYTVYINNSGTNPKALLTASRVVAIHSPGRDGTPIGPTTTYTVAPFIATDYNQDIVWGDGFMIRWPSGLANLITATP